MVRDEGEGATSEHFVTEVVHDRSSLEVEVAKHFVEAIGITRNVCEWSWFHH